jgi:hypothetical protein
MVPVTDRDGNEVVHADITTWLTPQPEAPRAWRKA